MWRFCKGHHGDKRNGGLTAPSDFTDASVRPLMSGIETRLIKYSIINVSGTERYKSYSAGWLSSVSTSLIFEEFLVDSVVLKTGFTTLKKKKSRNVRVEEFGL